MMMAVSAALIVKILLCLGTKSSAHTFDWNQEFSTHTAHIWKHVCFKMSQTI